MLIQNARVVVTGGSSGLGAGLAAAVARKGGRPVILDIRPPQQSDALYVETDVTSEVSVAAAFATIRERIGGVDVCVNAAGANPRHKVLGREGKLHPLDLFRRTLDLNLVGAFDVLRHAVAMMANNAPGEDGERGLIVNTASISALEGQAGQSAYAASKGALVSMTLPLARELAPLGIRVLTICPGVMHTPMFDELQPALKEQVERLPVFPKRLGTPVDFAGLVLHLIGNRWMNGEVIRLDAGTRL